MATSDQGDNNYIMLQEYPSADHTRNIDISLPDETLGHD